MPKPDRLKVTILVIPDRLRMTLFLGRNILDSQSGQNLGPERHLEAQFVTFVTFRTRNDPE